MKRNLKFSTALFVCSTVSLVVIGGGCAHRNQGKLPDARSHRVQEDSSFAAGAGQPFVARNDRFRV